MREISYNPQPGEQVKTLFHSKGDLGKTLGGNGARPYTNLTISREITHAHGKPLGVWMPDTNTDTLNRLAATLDTPLAEDNSCTVRLGSGSGIKAKRYRLRVVSEAFPLTFWGIYW